MPLNKTGQVRLTKLSSKNTRPAMFAGQDWVEGFLPFVPEPGQSVQLVPPIRTNKNDRWTWFHTSPIEKIVSRRNGAELHTRNSIWRVRYL